MDDQSLAQLADSAPSDPSAFFQLVGALKSRLHGFVMRDQLDVENDLRKELKRVRSHFSNLKGGFLQLETKQRFLTHLIQSNAIEPIDQSIVKEVEQRIADSKQEISQMQREIAETQRSLRQSIVDLLSKWRVLEDGTSNLAESFHPELTLQNKTQIGQLQKLLNEKDEDMDFALSESGLVSRISSDRTLVSSLTVQISRIRGDLELLQAEIEPLEEIVENLRNEIKLYKKNGRLSSSALNTASAKESTERVQLSATADWYSALSSTLATLSGVKIMNSQTIQEDGEIQVQLSSGAKTLEIAIELSEKENRHLLSSCGGKLPNQPITQAIIGARLISGQCDNFDEIMEYAMQTQDFNFLVREMQANLSC